jgi:hypothetical protein
LKQISAVAWSTIAALRWQCGSSSAPIAAAGPDERPHAREQVAVAVVISVGDHRPVEAEQDHVDREGPLQVGEQLVAQAS